MRNSSKTDEEEAYDVIEELDYDHEIIEEFVIENSEFAENDEADDQIIIIKSEESFRACEICDAQMANDPLVYHSHMQEEHHSTQFVCRNCNPCIVFDTCDYLQLHVEEHHPDYVFCEICNSTILNQDTLLKNHRREHRQFPFLCKACEIPKNFSNEQTLTKHILNTHW